VANLPIELAKAREEIERYAREYGLDFFETIFEIIDFEEMNHIAAYSGFPTRYPHWSFGMEYEHLAKGYEYGLSKIYEMVINNDPCYAYLLRSNPMVDQKLVMAHVFAHCDFFKNNYWFSKTNRHMIDDMANHATRMRRYIDRHGFEEVESFLDAVLTFNNLVDPHLPFQPPAPGDERRKAAERDEKDDSLERIPVPKLKSKTYMDAFINPPEFLEHQRQKIRDRRKQKKERFPEEPAKDVLGFLLAHAPLERWQQDVLSIAREEAYYFAPQGQTKIMNEGWAAYWHSTIMTQKVLKDSEVVDYADHHSGTVAPNPYRLNPYKLGLELFRHIEERWNKGKFGKEYDDCTDMQEKKHWDRKLGQGREKIFEVHKVYNDITFLDEFLTEEFCVEQKMFTFGFNAKSGNYEILSREFQKVKKSLLFALTNGGQPVIVVEDGNFENRGELLLLHKHEGVDLRPDWAKDVLANLVKVWKRPTNLLTFMEGKKKLLTYDGKEHRERAMETSAQRATD
jgi:stage V sporulation protein R